MDETNVDGFFEGIDAMDVMEQHVADVVSLEGSQADSILKTYLRIAGMLRAKLRLLPAESFTAQQTRVVLLQLEGAINALDRDLNKKVNESSDLLSDRAVGDLVVEVNKFSKKFTGSVQPIDIDAVQVAVQTKDRLFNKYKTSINTYSSTLRDKISGDLRDGVIARATPDEIINRLSGTFDGEAWRLRRIVRTELHGIYSQAKLLSLKESRDTVLPNLMKTLYHPMDSRTGKDSQYAESKHLIVPLDEPFKYRWKGKERIFQTPPDRPMDRSILIPYDPEWIK